MRQTYELWDSEREGPVSTALMTEEQAAELNANIVTTHGPDAPLHWRLQGSAGGAAGSVTGAVVIDYRQLQPGEIIPELSAPVRVYRCPNCALPGVLRMHGDEQRMSHVEAQFGGGRELRVSCDLSDLTGLYAELTPVN